MKTSKENEIKATMLLLENHLEILSYSINAMFRLHQNLIELLNSQEKKQTTNKKHK